MAVNAYYGLPFSYCAGTSFLHRQNPLIKLLVIFAISLAAFFPDINENTGAGRLIFLSCLNLFIICVALAAKINPLRLLRGSRPIVIMLIFVAAFRAVNFNENCFDRGGLCEAFFFAWRIIISFSAGSLFFTVTTMSELSDVLPSCSLPFCLMLMFIPRFFEKWHECQAAYRSRGGKSGICEYALLIPLVVERMMECAAETACALEARNI